MLAVLALGIGTAQAAEQISIGQRYRIDSKQMQESRSYMVHTPPGYAFAKDAYPVLVVLDGDTLFAQLAAVTDFLSDNERIPKMLVVGVPNTDRGRDLNAPRENAAAPVVGGPDRFLAFIGDELIPEIERKYRTRNYRVIAGHSSGGMFALYTLPARSNLFNGYLAINPAFDGQDGLAKRIDAFLSANGTYRADLYMTMGNEPRTNQAGGFEMAATIQRRASRELRWQYRRYPEETHFSTIMRGTYDGLEAIFSGYYIHDPFVIFEQGGLAALEKNYASVSTRLGYSVQVPEQVLVSLVNSLEGRTRNEEAAKIVDRAAEVYPSSALVHFYGGRIYSKLGDKKRSVEHYAKAYEIAPSSFRSLRTLLKEQGVDPETIVPTFDLPKGSLRNYVGRYGASDVEIVARDNVLVARISDREYTLRPMSATKFYYVNGEDVLIFREDGRGKIVSVTLQSTGAELARTP
jgi:predicted alpha/beta superfamily hydrolase